MQAILKVPQKATILSGYPSLTDGAKWMQGPNSNAQGVLPTIGADVHNLVPLV